MRILITTICLLISNLVFSCVYFYTGDDIRIQLLKSNNWGYDEYFDFDYSHSYINTSAYNYNYLEENENISFSNIDKYACNLNLWVNYCDNKVDIEDIYNAIYVEDIRVSKDNAFVSYLKKNKKTEALRYLIFAQKSTPFNMVNYYNSWETDDNSINKKSSRMVKKANSLLNKTKDPEIKRRYAFLVIRLAYYNNNYNTVENKFNQYFKDSEKDILYYWSLHYNNPNNTNEYENTFNKAQIFFNSYDKRIVTYYNFDADLEKKEVLAYAKDNNEKEAVEFFYAVKNSGQAIDEIKAMHSLNPSSKQLDFLLIREINKIEDWILTPQYTQFDNIIYNSREKQYKNIKERVAEDKNYANMLLGFLLGIDKTQLNNQVLWETSIAYLYQIVDMPKDALSYYSKIENTYNLNNEQKEEIDRLKVLSLVSVQNTYPKITNEIADIIYRNKEDNSLLFTLAAEYYRKGNIIDAICLFSTIPEYSQKPINLDYRLYYTYGDISSYFEFADIFATHNDMDNLINYVKYNLTVSDEFNKWYKSTLLLEENRILDLAGTKKLRVDNLEEALDYYKQINKGYWKSSYAYSNYLDANPFYTDLTYSHSKSLGDTIRYNKAEIVGLLIHYLEKANNPNNKNRDLDYFTAANCYYNMTYNGNSWIMKKYYWSGAHTYVESENTHEAKEDLNDYFNAHLATKYYSLAGKYGQTEQFSALCFTMAGKCKKAEIISQNQNWDGEYVDPDENQLFTKVSKKYPAYYDDMVSNCIFEKYYFARLAL